MSSETVYSPHHPSFSWLFVAFFIIAASALFFEVTGAAFADIGLSPMTAALVVGASLLGSYVNIPIASIRSEQLGIVSIGGGGTFDGVFLSGIVAVLLA